MTTTAFPRRTYLNHEYGIKSWLLTKDHKRIGLMYLVFVTLAFMLGGVFAAGVRAELTTPAGDLWSSDTYNKLFTMHGIMMVFFVLIPAVPAILGNFVLPLMIGAKDVAFPKINLISWYIFVIGMFVTVSAMVLGGVDTGWTFYVPYSTQASNTNVMVTGIGVFITGFSSILTGVNFMVTIHRMRAPGMTWFRLPLLVWALYATSLVQILGTPVIAITVFMLALERGLGFGIFDPALGGDPVLFQHLFWFYSHPAVYIMILPPMGVISEVIACFSRKSVFGYSFVAFSSLAIAVFGFVVAHFHYIMVGGAIMGFFAGLHYYWPKITGRMYNDTLGKLSAVLIFIGFNLTFFPQFILGYLGMPRRYHAYPPEFQVFNVLSTAGASILGVGYLLPFIYFIWSIKRGRAAGPNPWRATGLEWQTPSPPPKHNFKKTPVVTGPPYMYSAEKDVDLDLATI